MPWFECQTCKGVYQDVDGQGYRYFHVCALIANLDYQPDPRQPAYDPRQVIERPNHRDENTRPDPQTGTPTTKKEGLGRAPFSVEEKRGKP